MYAMKKMRNEHTMNIFRTPTTVNLKVKVNERSDFDNLSTYLFCMFLFYDSSEKKTQSRKNLYTLHEGMCIDRISEKQAIKIEIHLFVYSTYR
jgi:hypothetical protein